jgi:hypothetical protein
MSNFNNFDIEIHRGISNQWLEIIKTMPTNNNRITDYVRPLVNLLKLYDPSKYSTTQNQSIQTWMRQMYNFLSDESFVTKRFTNTNWHACRLWVMSEIAIILKNSQYISILRTELVKYIDISLREYARNDPNYGALIDFKHRDSIAYQVYTLNAILNVIVNLEKDFKNTTSANNFTILWRSDSSLRGHIKPAIDFVIPYLNGDKIHLEYINSQVQSDRRSNDFGKPFIPRNGTYLYTFMVQNDFIKE